MVPVSAMFIVLVVDILILSILIMHVQLDHRKHVLPPLAVQFWIGLALDPISPRALLHFHIGQKVWQSVTKVKTYQVGCDGNLVDNLHDSKTNQAKPCFSQLILSLWYFWMLQNSWNQMGRKTNQHQPQPCSGNAAARTLALSPDNTVRPCAPTSGHVSGADGCHGSSLPVDLQNQLRSRWLRCGLAVDHHFDFRPGRSHWALTPSRPCWPWWWLNIHQKCV